LRAHGHGSSTLALAAGTSRETIGALLEGYRPQSMSEVEAKVHDFVCQLLNTRGVPNHV
jgi:hypothetical protein